MLECLKKPSGKECKICQRPFTVFRWKAGTKGRFKATEICQTCAKLKNVCQTCLFDLEYGLPVEVRDKYLEDAKIEIPGAGANRDYWAEEANRNIDNLILPYNDPEKNKVLEQFARNKPYYKRNLPHLCSFYQKGSCIRGDECPYRHELPEESAIPDQKLQDRYHGQNDPLANKILHKITGSKTVRPPEDKSITSLIVRDLKPEVTEGDLKEEFEKFGTVDNIRMIPDKTMAVVTFGNRADSENAIKELYGKLVVKESRLYLGWAKYDSNTKIVEEITAPADDFQLVPQQFTIPVIKGRVGNPNVKPPSLPPPDMTLNPNTSMKFIKDLSKPGNSINYPSMNPNSLGGVRGQFNKS